MVYLIFSPHRLLDTTGSDGGEIRRLNWMRRIEVDIDFVVFVVSLPDCCEKVGLATVGAFW